MEVRGLLGLGQPQGLDLGQPQGLEKQKYGIIFILVSLSRRKEGFR